MLEVEAWALLCSTNTVMLKGNWQAAERTVPVINLEHCDGCGLCVRACLSGALAMHGRKAIIARPGACVYAGLCAMMCPRGAAQLLFEIVTIDATNALRQDEKPTQVDDNRASRSSHSAPIRASRSNKGGRPSRAPVHCGKFPKGWA